MRGRCLGSEEGLRDKKLALDFGRTSFFHTDKLQIAFGSAREDSKGLDFNPKCILRELLAQFLSISLECARVGFHWVS